MIRMKLSYTNWPLARNPQGLGRVSAAVGAACCCAIVTFSLMAGERSDSGDAPAKPVLRVLTLNLGHGRGSSAQAVGLPKETIEKHLSAVANLLTSEQPDVVALQEADKPSVFSGDFDHVEFLKREAKYEHSHHGLHFDQGVGPLRAQTGTALLSHRELHATHSHRFHANDFVNAKGFAAAEIDFADRRLLLVNVHLHSGDPAMRRKQVDEITKFARGKGLPVIVVGDLNSQWKAAEDGVRRLTEALQLHTFDGPSEILATFPATGPQRRLDWILVSHELEFVSYRTLPHVVSDHLAVVAELRWTDAELRMKKAG